ncbi:hypothetical protein [Streptomyces netropsis]|uniref:Uncharacterized protein n=1 Tax=Streptomyces netropsis TaxID=55404 RepID=A0A7W7LIQ6_STRNE|nr:hypothetical protein [Streptomyces netropsis]MBB4890995.1 hypothetical protein [Streptomyces netropsis]
MSHFVQATEAARDAYAHYDPPAMLAVAAEYEGLPEGISAVGQAIRDLVLNTADRYPVDKALAEQLAVVFAHVHAAESKAAEVAHLFRDLHEHDLKRYEEPRPGEHMWNIFERRLDGTYARRPSVFVLACQDIAHTYARNELTRMMNGPSVAAEYEGLPTGLENIAAAIRFLAVKSAEAYPVEKPVAEAVAEVEHQLMRAVSAAQELFPRFRRLHAPDIKRHEAPRNGTVAEAMWDA